MFLCEGDVISDVCVQLVAIRSALFWLKDFLMRYSAVSVFDAGLSSVSMGFIICFNTRISS